MNLDDLLQTMVGRAGSAATTDPTTGGPGLGGLLEGLLGGDTAPAAQAGLSPALLQSALALVLGKLAAGRSAAATGELTSGIGSSAEDPSPVSLTGLLEQMRGGTRVDDNALEATGLPQQLAAQAGINLPQALKALQAILSLLTGQKTPAKAKSRTRRTMPAKRSTTRPRAKTSPKAKSTSTSRAKTTRKSSTTDDETTTKRRGAAKPKTARKPATTDDETPSKRRSTTKPKTARKSKGTSSARPKTTRTPRRTKTSDEAPATDAGLDDLLKKW